jgi:hypothetical protein
MSLRRLEFPPIFIVGNPRSGTSWLAQLLGSHPQLASSRESHLFNFYLERFFTERDRWMRYWVDDTTLDDLIGELVSGIFQAKLAATGKQRIVEKTPTHRHWVRTIRRIFPTASFIHCIRDGRDVALSMLARRRRTGEDWIPETLEGCAERWKEGIELLQHYKQEQVDHAVVEIRYEDLSRSPEETLFRVLQGVGEETSHEDLVKMVEAHPGMPNQTEKWRHKLSPQQQMLFARVAGDALASLGYPN